MSRMDATPVIIKILEARLLFGETMSCGQKSVQEKRAEALATDRCGSWQVCSSHWKSKFVFYPCSAPQNRGFSGIWTFTMAIWRTALQFYFFGPFLFVVSKGFFLSFSWAYISWVFVVNFAIVFRCFWWCQGNWHFGGSVSFSFCWPVFNIAKKIRLLWIHRLTMPKGSLGKGVQSVSWQIWSRNLVVALFVFVCCSFLSLMLHECSTGVLSWRGHSTKEKHLNTSCINKQSYRFLLAMVPVQVRFLSTTNRVHCWKDKVVFPVPKKLRDFKMRACLRKVCSLDSHSPTGNQNDSVWQFFASTFRTRFCLDSTGVTENSHQHAC